MKQTKTVYALVWTKKWAEVWGAKEGDIVCEEPKNFITGQPFVVDYPFYEKKRDAIIARGGNKDFKVVKMEITYKLL